MKRLWLVRHPQVAVPPGICYGRTDVALAAAPDAMAAALRACLPGNFGLLSSPLRRCAELARLLHPAPRFDARLQEIDFGDWEMQRYDALPRADIDQWATDVWGFRPPGGESANDMARRVDAAWAEHRHDIQVVVAHGGPLKVIAGRLLDLPQAAWLDIRCPQGGWIELRHDGLRWQQTGQEVDGPGARPGVGGA